MEQYSPGIKHNFVSVYRFCNYRYIVIVDSGSVSGGTTCLSCRYELCRVFINFPSMQTGPPACWIFFLYVNAISRGHGESGGDSDPCFPDISHNVEKRLRIRTLFHVRAFKLIMDGRIPLSSLFSTPRRFRREKRAREGEGGGRGREACRSGDCGYIQREWMDGECWVFGWMGRVVCINMEIS